GLESRERDAGRAPLERREVSGFQAGQPCEHRGHRLVAQVVHALRKFGVAFRRLALDGDGVGIELCRAADRFHASTVGAPPADPLRQIKSGRPAGRTVYTCSSTSPFQPTDRSSLTRAYERASSSRSAWAPGSPGSTWCRPGGRPSTARSRSITSRACRLRTTR